MAGAETLGYSVRARTGVASEAAVRVLIQTGRALAELTDAGRAVIDEHRARGRDATTLTGLHAARRAPDARHRRRRLGRHLALPDHRRTRCPAQRSPGCSHPPAPPPLPTGSIAARRRVHASGQIMVNKQPIKLGPRHAGKLVTVIIEDTCHRILHGEEELAIKPRRDTTPITRLYARGKRTQPG